VGDKVNYQKFWNTEIETMQTEELIEKIHFPLLRQQLDFAYKNSQFYQKKFDEFGIKSGDFWSSDFELGKIPFSEKKEIMDDQEEYPPFGSLLAVPSEKLIRVHRTSGYSGRPVLIVLTKNDIDDTLEAGARMFWCAGVRPDDLVIHCLNYCLWIGGLTDHLSLEQTGATVIPYGVGNSKNLLELIKYIKPTSISCTPSYLSRLEELLREDFGIKPIDLQLKKGIFGGEAGLQNAEFRRNIEEKWGISAIDANFGVSDVLSAFGSECEFRNGLHFHGQGIIHVELINPVNESNLEFRKGQLGELVYTNLKREAQPLIRFRSHDMAEIVDADKCECGRTGFRFRILGRSDDMLVVRGINIFPVAIGNILLSYTNLLTGEYEIHLDSPPPYDYLHIKVEYRNGLSETEKFSVSDILKKAIREKLNFTAEIEMVLEGSIPRTDGKAKRIIRNF
jgi:phenylacetate-CoA ligase